MSADVTDPLAEAEAEAEAAAEAAEAAEAAAEAEAEAEAAAAAAAAAVAEVVETQAATPAAAAAEAEVEEIPAAAAAEEEIPAAAVVAAEAETRAATPAAAVAAAERPGATGSPGRSLRQTQKGPRVAAAAARRPLPETLARWLGAGCPTPGGQRPALRSRLRSLSQGSGGARRWRVLQVKPGTVQTPAGRPPS
jgi:hypothetical protein